MAVSLHLTKQQVNGFVFNLSSINQEIAFYFPTEADMVTFKLMVL